MQFFGYNLSAQFNYQILNHSLAISFLRDVPLELIESKRILIKLV
jgi:hypothetical protein